MGRIVPRPRSCTLSLRRARIWAAFGRHPLRLLMVAGIEPAQHERPVFSLSDAKLPARTQVAAPAYARYPGQKAITCQLHHQIAAPGSIKQDCLNFTYRRVRVRCVANTQSGCCYVMAPAFFARRAGVQETVLFSGRWRQRHPVRRGAWLSFTHVVVI